MEPKIEKYLETNIKDIINEFAAVQTALDNYEIGCAPCSLGTCKLKDVIGIHNLDEIQEKNLLTAIFNIIYQGESLDIPRITIEKKDKNNKSTLSPSLRELVEEHKIIKRLLALVPTIIEHINITKSEHKKLTLNVVDFIKNYADKFHHAKEENILFAYFDPSLDILKVMLHDHDTGRGFVRKIFKGVETNNNELIKLNLDNYCNLLTEHIMKEDTILYPWMDKNLDTRTIGDIFSKFASVNKEMQATKEKFEKYIADLESQFINKEVHPLR